MLHRTFPRAAHAGAIALFATLAAAACGDGPTGAGGKVIDVGSTITGTLSAAGQADTVVLESGDDAYAALFAQATQGTVVVRLLTVQNSFPMVQLQAEAGGGEQASDAMQLAAKTRYRIVVSAGAGAAAYRVRVAAVNTRPERASAAIAIGQVVTGERLESPQDVDEFTFNAAAGDVFDASILAPQAGTGTVELNVTLDGADMFNQEAVSTAGDTELEAQSTGRFTASKAGEYRLRVSAPPVPSPAYRGDYRVQVRRVGLLPESRPPALTAGDTLAGEAIEHVGDVDTYHFAGTAGDRYNVFFQAGPGTQGRLMLSIGQGPNVPTVYSDGQQPLLHGGLGAFDMPGGGADVRVQGASDRELNRGPYRIFAYRIDRAPEHAPATLALGGTVSDRIDMPGDEDVYTFDLAEKTSVLMSLLGSDRAGEGSFRAWLEGPAGLVGNALFSFADRPGVGSGLTELNAGHYTVHVGAGSSTGAGLTTAYQFSIHRFDPAPENAPAALVIGDTVAESLRPLGDGDRFTFQATAGQQLTVLLKGSGGTNPLLGGMYAVVEDADHGYVRALYTAFTATGWSGTRFVAPATGTYRIVFNPMNATPLWEDQGDYRFALLATSTAPEHVAATAAQGSTVTGEALDYPADVDAFTVAATPGASMQLSLSYAGPGGVVVEARDAKTGEPLAVNYAYPADPEPRFTVPASGLVRVTVLENYFCQGTGTCDFSAKGPYQLTIR